MDGWVRLHRKIRQNPIFNDMELYRLWSICLTEATYKERDQIIGRQTVHLMPGEFVTGRFDLQSMYNSGLKVDQQKSPKTVWRWLEALENGEFLTIKSTNKYSVVALVNWHLYQSDDQQFDQQVTNKRPTDDQQVTTNKKEKNLKKDKESKEDKPSSRKRPVYESDSIPYRSASYLLKKIKEHSPGIKAPNLQQWANDMRLLIETDKREPITIANVIDWATSDGFWQTNILSASKLREKFDTLQGQMKRGGNNGHVISDSGSIQQHTEPEPDWNKFVYRGPA